MNASFASGTDGYASDTDSIDATPTPSAHNLAIFRITPEARDAYTASVSYVACDKTRFSRGSAVVTTGELG